MYVCERVDTQARTNIHTQGKAILADFETSREEANPSVTGTTTTVVTAGYTAPEVPHH